MPCSFLTPVINRVITRKDIRYVPAASEGEATAIAAGAWLAGRKTVLICQNSGLGNAINPLTSLRGRTQFSELKAYRVRYSTPASRLARSAARTDSAPA